MFEYDQRGTLLREAFFPNGVAPVGIAVNSAGDLYVVDGSRAVEKLDDRGTVIGTITADTGATGLALDQESNDLYVDEGTSIELFESSCDPSTSPCLLAGSFGSGHLTGASGVGVDSASGTVYAGDGAANQVDVFAPATLARVITASASNVQPTAPPSMAPLIPAVCRSPIATSSTGRRPLTDAPSRAPRTSVQVLAPLPSTPMSLPSALPRGTTSG